MARILLGVTGGIAAYKALEFARLAIKSGHVVRVVMTPASTKFVGRSSFEGITGAPVLIDAFEEDPVRGTFPDQEPPEHTPISHLELAENCDVFVIAPASANTIAKLAAGLADNLLTDLYLACERPVIVAPAMNSKMYLHASTQGNLRALRERGNVLLDPGTGELASKGEHGIGRLPEPVEILGALEAQLATGPRPLDGLRVLITAGGTREPIDAVRYIGNRSSGRMGLAIAQAAARMGAEVTVLAANISTERPPGVKFVDVQTAAELQQAVLDRLPDAGVLVMTAAVADFRPRSRAGGKIKKAGRDVLTLELEETQDILALVAAAKSPQQVIVGFAAEHGDPLPEASRKLQHKGLDMVVGNDISDANIGFDSTDNEVVIVQADGAVDRPPRGSKQVVAQVIVDQICQLVARSQAPVDGPA